MKKQFGVAGLLTCVTITTIVLSGNGRSNSFKSACEPTTPTLTAALERLIDNDNEKNLEGVLAGYTDDAVLLPPKEPILTGKAALRSNYERLLSSSAIKLSIEAVETRADGDLGFVRGFVKGTVTPKEGVPPTVVHDKFIGIVRCEKGQWRVSHLMWSPEISSP